MQVSGGSSLQIQLSQALQLQAEATNQHLQQTSAKVQQTKESVLENAVQQANRVAQAKGRLVDVTA